MKANKEEGKRRVAERKIINLEIQFCLNEPERSKKNRCPFMSFLVRCVISVNSPLHWFEFTRLWRNDVSNWRQCFINQWFFMVIIHLWNRFKNFLLICCRANRCCELSEVFPSSSGKALKLRGLKLDEETAKGHREKTKKLIKYPINNEARKKNVLVAKKVIQFAHFVRS